MSNFGLNKYQEDALPLPIIHFLKTFVNAKFTGNKEYALIANQIEKNILKGKILQNQSSVAPDFYYQPEGTNKNLPFHLTSSLVSELAPLTIFLKSYFESSHFIIEEPEAHLHLSMQRILVRYLVQLINKGLPIWLTTHSDTVFQQVNNLIALSQHPNKAALCEKLGYSEDDLLSPQDVRAYQFQVTPDGTVIKSIAVTEDGFPAFTFNQVLYDLGKESYAIQDDDSEN